MKTKYVIIFFDNNDTYVFETFENETIAQQWGDANIKTHHDNGDIDDDKMWHVTKLQTRGK